MALRSVLRHRERTGSTVPARLPLAYACGPTSFVEAVSQALVQSGYPPERVKTERFGATGGT